MTGKRSPGVEKILNVVDHQLVTELPCTYSAGCVLYFSCLDMTQLMSVQEGNECRWAPDSIALLINSQAPYSGPKNHRNLEFSPYSHMYKPECSMAYKLGFEKKKKNYVAINQTCVLLIRKTGFSIFLIKYFYHLEDTNYISWFGRDKPEKKSGLTFTLSISWFLCFIVYIFYILLLTL